jgi:hypothetical protein
MRYLVALALLTLATPASAQEVIRYVGSDRKPVPVDQTHPLPVAIPGPTPASSAPIVTNPVDGSGTVAVGSASQQVFAANPSRVLLSCQNPISSTETLFISVGSPASVAGGSWELGPGQLFTNPSGVSLTGAVFVTSATAGHRFICKQG